MARTLSGYIRRKFWLAILATFLVCSVLIFMIDIVEVLRQQGKSKAAVPLWRIVQITLLRLPAYTEFLIGFAVLVGSMIAFLMLARKSELTVMRAGGMSAWRFVWPGVTVALAIGVFGVLVYNPLAAAARDYGDKLYAETFGRDSNLFKTGAGSWLRQDGVDGQSVIGAAAARNRGIELSGVTAYVFDTAGKFTERVDAARGELREGYWRLEDAWVTRVTGAAERVDTYVLATYLTPERVADALGTIIAVSVWELPGLIEVAEKAKLSSSRLRIQYELLLSRPLLCVAMVFLAATVSLRSFRSGGLQTMVMTGMAGGFGFLLAAEVSRQIGVAGLVPPWPAVWLPILLLLVLTTTVLLHQEDG
jgi:lipopolysaccharide export system permease protein